MANQPLCRLDGKTAMITGAGIGEATARLFAQQGASVVVFDRDGSGAENVAAAIGASDGRAIFVAGDVWDLRW